MNHYDEAMKRRERIDKAIAEQRLKDIRKILNIKK